MNWENQFQSWGQPPSATEQTKCDHAERIVKSALDASEDLARHTIRVLTHGSYTNRTNVRLESDVDMCVVCQDVVFTDYSMSEGLSNADVGLIDSNYTYDTFKNEVQAALVAYFGSSAVTRGDKALNLHENTYRVSADVLPCWEHRRYHGRPGGKIYHHLGIAFIPDSSQVRIENWPEQNYSNGVLKNNATRRRFKAIVRIIKRLQYQMAEEGRLGTAPIPGYLIECLVWNVPNEGFGHPTHVADVRWALAHIFNHTRALEDCREWGEINELKYLFRAGQSWTLPQAHAFASVTWDYLGLDK